MSWSEFSQKVSIKRPGLSQVLRASVHENQGKVFIKQPVLSQILEVLNKQVF